MHIALHVWADSVERWRMSYAVPIRALAIYRITFVLFVLIVQGLPSYVWLDSIPDAFFRPPLLSPASLIGGVPGRFVLALITVVVAVLYVLVLFGYRTSWSSFLLGSALLLGNSVVYSFGKVNHDELFIVMVPLVMAFSRWGEMYSLDARAGRRGRTSATWPVAILALFLGFAMFTAAMPKIRGGWLDPSSQAVQGHLLNRFYSFGSDDYLAPILVNAVLPPWVWETLDYVTVTFELTFLFAAVRLKLFRVYVGLATVFHLINLLVLNIAFTSNLALYLLFIPWRPLVGWLRREERLPMFTVFSSVRWFWPVLGATLLFTTARLVLAPDVSENALRSVANQDAPRLVSPWNLIEYLLHVRIDLNLALLLLATIIVMLTVAATARSHMASRSAQSRELRANE